MHQKKESVTVNRKKPVQLNPQLAHMTRAAAQQTTPAAACNKGCHNQAT
jgi:hypothetical protein